MSPAALAYALRRAFTAAPPLFEHEAQLQQIVHDALRSCLLPHHRAYREVRLNSRDRLDFLVSHFDPAHPPSTSESRGIAIEVKVGGSLSDLTRQLARYAESERITGLLVVTTKDRHRQLPPSLGGKPIACLCLSDFTLGF